MNQLEAMHSLIAGESVSRISRQSGHALPQPSAWNRTPSIGFSPAGLYSVFAKVTDCLQSGGIWPQAGPEVSSPESTLLTIFSISFRFVLFRFVPFRVLLASVASPVTDHVNGKF